MAANAMKAKVLTEKMNNAKTSTIIGAVLEAGTKSNDSFESVHAEEVNEYIYPDFPSLNTLSGHAQWMHQLHVLQPP